MEPESNLLTITGTGTVSIEERYDCLSRLVWDKTIAPNIHILIDVRRVTNVPTTEECFSIITLIDQLQFRFTGRLAILNNGTGRVTTTHLIVAGAKSGPDKLKAFISEPAARQWLLHGGQVLDQ